ncbi:HAD family hydrolase [Microbacterium sp. KUDC0406]|nr:HAD family hydrolase [Microbacterium sp. KUDC0406]
MLTAADELGVEWTGADQAVTRGHGMWAVAARFREKGAALTEAAVVSQIERAAAELAVTAPPVWLPGVREMLIDCADAGIRCGLVTMSGREAVEAILRALDPGLFEVIVSGSDVTEPKPAPQPYLRGLDALGLSAESCLAIEDSFVGVTSAVAAGLTTIAVNAPPTIVESESLVRWPGMRGRSVADLRRVHAIAAARTGAESPGVRKSLEF